MLDPQALLDLLKAKHIPYTLYSHPPVGSGDCDDLFPAMKGEILKNLVLRTKKGKLVLFTLPLKAHADLKAIASALGVPVQDLISDWEAVDKEEFKRVFIYGEGIKDRIDAALDRLNDEGQEKAAERVEELTEIPKYQK